MNTPGTDPHQLVTITGRQRDRPLHPRGHNKHPLRQKDRKICQPTTNTNVKQRQSTSRAVGAGHEKIGGRLGMPVRDRPDPGVLREGHLPPARPRPKSPPFVAILSRCRREPSRLSWISSGTRSSPLELESAVTEPGVTKAQPRASARWSPGRRPRCAGKPPGPPGLGLVKPGAWMPEQVINPAGFFGCLARAGLRAREHCRCDGGHFVTCGQA